VVGAREAARGEQHHEEEGGGREADDDGGEHQRLRQRIGELRTRKRAVVAKPMTMAVSTSACGSGSANFETSTVPPRSTIGGSPARTQPIAKMKRFTA
jgi:hypothetical protein